MKWKWPRCSAACRDEILQHDAQTIKALLRMANKTDYTAWVIEISDTTDGPEYFRPSDNDDWVKDHDKALHFARQADAETIIEYYGWTRAKAVEHMWPQPFMSTNHSSPANAECPFCGGPVDPAGWMSSDKATGPACDDCGASAPTLESWNGWKARSVHAPVENKVWPTGTGNTPQDVQLTSLVTRPVRGRPAVTPDCAGSETVMRPEGGDAND